MAQKEGVSLLKSIPNLRDVGATINLFRNNQHKAWDTDFWRQTSSKDVKEGVLFRGARPDEATEADRQRLLNDYKIKSIIDLRTKTEHIEASKKRNAQAVVSSAAVPQSNDAAAEPLKIPGIKYHELNFNGRAFNWKLIKTLTWSQVFWLIVLMVLGRRKEAIKNSLAPKMEAMGLTGLAIASVDVCTKEVREFFKILADESNLPVLVHCTQGKDRTGLTVMLVLFLLRVNVTAVEYDYLLTGPALEAEMEERVKEIASIGLSRRFAECPIGMVEDVHHHIDIKYGGIINYLDHVGVDCEMRDRVMRNLLKE